MKDRDCRERVKELARTLWASPGDFTTPLLHSATGSRLDNLDWKISCLDRNLLETRKQLRQLIAVLGLEVVHVEATSAKCVIRKAKKTSKK